MAFNPGAGSSGGMNRGEFPGASDGFSREGSSNGTAAAAFAKTCIIAGTRVIFELEWSPTQDRGHPDAEFQRARKLGYSFATMLPDKSLVGLARGLQPGPGRPHSAVVMLIERFASGGAEAVLLSAGNRVAFIGLMDRRPVPGFDRLVNSLESALALLKEFRDIHIDQDVRVATDLPNVVANGEPLEVQTVFEMPEASSLVRPLVNRVMRRAVAGGVTAAVLLGSGLGYVLWGQYQERKAAEEAARLAQENDPNRLYERSIEPMLRSAGQPGNAVLDRWRAMLNRVPLSREGWALQRFTCTQSSPDCEATWSRNFGNFNDFLTRPPQDRKSPDPQLNPDNASNDLLGSTITTHYTWGDSGPVAEVLTREQLPQVAAVTESWGSRLQDVSLVAGSQQAAMLKPAQLFGPTTVTDLKALHRPVVRLAWQVSDGLWSLPSIDLPPTAVPDTLTVQLNAGQITYTLTGHIYAKGKNF